MVFRNRTFSYRNEFWFSVPPNWYKENHSNILLNKGENRFIFTPPPLFVWMRREKKTQESAYNLFSHTKKIHIKYRSLAFFFILYCFSLFYLFWHYKSRQKRCCVIHQLTHVYGYLSYNICVILIRTKMLLYYDKMSWL